MTLPNTTATRKFTIEVTMPLEEARKVPFQGNKHGLMGELLDRKQLDGRDLVWEMQNAYNPRAREAARTLLAYWLGQPDAAQITSRYGPEVVEGSRYLREQELDGIIKSSGALGILMGLAVYATLDFIRWIFNNGINSLLQGNRAAIIGSALAVLVSVVIAISIFRKNVWNEMKRSSNFREGREGEEAVVERLRAALDNRWTIFRNVILPRNKYDLDVVLVGPGGVWLLEIKAYKGTVRAHGKRWERQTKRGWKALDDSPALVTRRAAALNEFLQRHGLNRWVEKAIVMAKPQPISNFEQCDTTVWLLDQVEDCARQLTTRKPPTDKEIETIVATLKEIAAKQRATEEEKATW